MMNYIGCVTDAGRTHLFLSLSFAFALRTLFSLITSPGSLLTEPLPDLRIEERLNDDAAELPRGGKRDETALE
jgi:hypothetical protein